MPVRRLGCGIRGCKGLSAFKRIDMAFSVEKVVSALLTVLRLFIFPGTDVCASEEGQRTI